MNEKKITYLESLNFSKSFISNSYKQALANLTSTKLDSKRVVMEMLKKDDPLGADSRKGLEDLRETDPSQMAKIKVVLDQETWVSIDVPDEFQAIIFSLSSSEEQLNIGHAEEISSGSPIGSNQRKKVDSIPGRNADENVEDIVRATSQTLVYGGVGYHVVNYGLILLKMLAGCVDISKCLPALSYEVVHRVAEILKLFNTRTCQLVFGAGAMQVSGLKSITSKHLTLASKIISFVYAIIPEIQNVLFLKIPEDRKGLLLSEIERVTQDYKVHRDEIHSKLVQIMRERLLVILRKLPQIVDAWNVPEDNDLQLNQFDQHVTKEVTYLHRILSQILLEADVQAIFRQVVQIFHSHISEEFMFDFGHLKCENEEPEREGELVLVQHIDKIDNDKPLCEVSYKILGKITIIIWNWYYKIIFGSIIVIIWNWYYKDSGC